VAALADRGLVIGVATNDETRTAKESLVTAGFDLTLVHVLGSDAVSKAKPAPDMVMAFAAATGVPLAKIVVVGDNATDLQMARAAGAGFAVGVTSGNGNEGDLGPLADAVLGSVRELPGWVDWQVSG
jgi:phosphoglycolate phosphatase